MVEGERKVQIARVGLRVYVSIEAGEMEGKGDSKSVGGGWKGKVAEVGWGEMIGVLVLDQEDRKEPCQVN